MASAPQNIEETVQIPVPTPCDLCDSEEEVNSFCRICAQKLCDVCKKSHLRTTTTRDHVIVHISEGPCLAEEPTICREHLHTFSFYCRSCGVLSCPKCLTKRHKGHDFVDTDEYAEEIRNKSAALISQTKREKEEEKRNLKAVEEARANYLKEMNANKDSVRKVTNRIIDEVREIQKEMLSEICKKESSDLAIFDIKKKHITEKENQLENSIQKMKLNSESTDNIALIRSADLLQRRLPPVDNHDISKIVPIVYVIDGSKGKADLKKMVGFLQCKDPLQLNNKLNPQPEEPSIQKETIVNEPVEKLTSFKCSCIENRRRFIYEYKENRCKLCGKPVR